MQYLSVWKADSTCVEEGALLHIEACGRAGEGDGVNHVHFPLELQVPYLGKFRSARSVAFRKDIAVADSRLEWAVQVDMKGFAIRFLVVATAKNE